MFFKLFIFASIIGFILGSAISFIIAIPTLSPFIIMIVWFLTCYLVLKT